MSVLNMKYVADYDGPDDEEQVVLAESLDRPEPDDDLVIISLDDDDDAPRASRPGPNPYPKPKRVDLEDEARWRWHKMDARDKGLMIGSVAMAVGIFLAVICRLVFFQADGTLSESVIGAIVTEQLKWSDGALMEYTTQNGARYQMACEQIFVSGPFALEEKVPLAQTPTKDYDYSYKEVQNQTFYSEWYDESGQFPAVHAARLLRLGRNQVVCVVQRYTVIPGSELQKVAAADLEAYLADRILKIQISLDTSPQKYSFQKASFNLDQ